MPINPVIASPMGPAMDVPAAMADRVPRIPVVTPARRY